MLYDTHQAGAYRLALLLTANDAPLAEDLVADAFVAVYPRWRDGKVEHFEHYLHRTVPELGFARQGPHDEVAEIKLWCRPCGVHGRSRCPLGHHRCMKRLDPDLAFVALGRALGSPVERSGTTAAAHRA